VTLAMALMSAVSAIGSNYAAATQARSGGASAGAAGETRPADQATLEESAPINNLIKRAQQGIERGDWKLAIDSLQRIIEDPHEVLIERQPGRYESSRRYGLRLLAGLPDEGRAAYRILYDGRAKAAFDAAAGRSDAAALRQVVDDYLLSSWGDDAADLLSSWELDEGRAASALRLLDDVAEFCPDPDVDPGRMTAKRAVAHALLAERALAEKDLAIAEEHLQPTTGEALRNLIGPLVQAPAGAASTASTDSEVLGARRDYGSSASLGPGEECWPIPGAPRVMPAVTPALVSKLPWRRALPDSVAADWAEYLGRRDDLALPPVFQAVAAGGRMFVKGPGPCTAIDLTSFDVLWQPDSPVERIAERHARRWQRFATEYAQGGSLSLSRGDALVSDSIGAALSVAGDLLLSLERLGGGLSFDSEGIVVQRGGRGGVRIRWWDPVDQQDAFSGCRLAAYDTATGALRWTTGPGTQAPDELGEAQFLGPPIGLMGTAPERQSDDASKERIEKGIVHQRAGVRRDSRISGGLPSGIVPTAAAGWLWAPVLLDRTLCLVAMDPQTGRLVQRVTLCTPPEKAESSADGYDAQYVAASGGVLYVPTGHGLLFAVRAADAAPLWAARYDQIAGWYQRTLGPRATGWASSPPAVVGDLVLLAPTDGDDLLAFDARNGELRWSQPGGAYRYVIAADAEVVLLGGEEIGCRSTSDGRPRWTVQTASPTGRAIRSGDRVYVPTVEGLIGLAVSDGKEVWRAVMPPGHPPLGNLLAVSDGLVSVDAHEVRKYPDLDQAYQRAVAGHSADPAAAKPALRLAWLELLQGAPTQALAVLEKAGQGQPEPDPLAAEQTAHLRVEALLTLAEQLSGGRPPSRPTVPGDDADQAVAYLEQAMRYAKSGPDVMRAGLAFGRHLQEMGRFEAAYDCLWRLACSDAADAPIEVEQDVTRNARVSLGGQLRDLESRLPGEALRRAQESAAASVRAAVAELWSLSPDREAGGIFSESAVRGARMLRLLADAGAAGGWDQAALIELARWEVERGRYEAAEQDYQAAIRLERNQVQTARALLGLAELYVRPDQQLVLAAGDCLDRLEREFAAVELPIEGNTRETGSTRGEARGSNEPVSLAVQRMRQSLNAALAAAHHEALDLAPFRLRTEAAWPEPLEADRPQLLVVGAGGATGATRPGYGNGGRASRPEALAERCLVATDTLAVQAYRVHDGTMEWEAQLRLPDQFQSEDLLAPALPQSEQPVQVVGTDGQTLVVVAPEGLHALGMATGKRLWAVPFEGPSISDGVSGARRLAAVGDGWVAAVFERGRLGVRSVRDGSVLWERSLDPGAPGRPDAVDIYEGCVLVAADGFGTIAVYDLADGRELGQMQFRGLSPWSDPIEPIFARGMVCGPDDSAVVGYKLDRSAMESAATGAEHQGRGVSPRTLQPAWTRDLGDTAVTLLQPSEDLVGAATPDGTLRLLEVETGDTMFEEAVTQPGRCVVAGRIDGSVLVGVQMALDQTVSPALIGIDLVDKAVRWRRPDVLAGWDRGQAFGIARGVMPAVVLRDPEADDPRAASGKLGWCVIDTQTGQDVGPVIVADLNAFGMRIVGDVSVWPGALVMGAGNRVFALRTEPLAAGEGR